jgi:hypothetical protein
MGEREEETKMEKQQPKKKRIRQQQQSTNPYMQLARRPEGGRGSKNSCTRTLQIVWMMAPSILGQGSLFKRANRLIHKWRNSQNAAAYSAEKFRDYCWRKKADMQESGRRLLGNNGPQRHRRRRSHPS